MGEVVIGILAFLFCLSAVYANHKRREVNDLWNLVDDLEEVNKD